MASKYTISTVFRGIDNMSKPVRKMGASISKMTESAEVGLRKVDHYNGKMVKGFAIGGASIIAGATAVTAALNVLGEEVDELAKTARRLDMPIEDLQKWRFIAEQSGVSAGDMDKAFGTFAKRLGEARAGTGALNSTLSKLNPELLEQVKNADNVSDAFDLYVKGMREMKDPTEQAAAASAAFSKSGMKLIQISHNSASAITEMGDQMEKQGLVTQKQAEDAEAYNDAQNRLSKTIKGFTVSVLMPLFPVVTRIVDKLRDWGVANKGIVSEKIVSFISSTVGFFEKYGSYLPVVIKSIGVLLAVSAALKGLVLVMTAVNLVMAANPIVWVVAGIVAAIAAIAGAAYLIYKNWDGISAWFSDMWESIKTTFNIGFEFIKSAFGWSPLGMIIGNWSGIKGYFSDLFGGIASLYESTIGAVMGKVDAIKGKFGDVAESVSGGFEATKDFFSFGDDDEDIKRSMSIDANTVVTPQERISRSISENKETFDINVTGQNGAQVSSPMVSPRLNLINTGN